MNIDTSRGTEFASTAENGRTPSYDVNAKPASVRACRCVSCPMKRTVSPRSWRTVAMATAGGTLPPPSQVAKRISDISRASFRFPRDR